MFNSGTVSLGKDPDDSVSHFDSHFTASTEFILVPEQQQCNLGIDGNPVNNNNNNNKKKSAYNYWCSYWRNVCRTKTLYRRLPILTWLPKYNRDDAIGDIIAGITVGMTVIPQGLAYASVAGLPTEFGLYGSFMGCFVYVILGTCKDSTVGSTAIASLLVFQVAKGVWQRAVLLTFITGLIEIAMALLHLSFVVDFVSGPVSAGFTSAVTMIVFTSQMKNVLGLVESSGTTFLERWINMFHDMGNAHVPDIVLGVGCVLVLLLMRALGNVRVGPKASMDGTKAMPWHYAAINKVIWLVSVTRNASVVIVCAAINRYLETEGHHYFHLVGYIPPGLPSVGLPPFTLPPPSLVDGNGTMVNGVAQGGETFWEMIGNMGTGLITVPLIALLENISVCKAFGEGKAIDASQELLAMGVANIANSFLKGYRANGGLARSAVNNASGVRTPLSNFYIGGVVMLALLFLTQQFYFIPKAALSAIIIAAVIFQLQYQVIVPMWRSKRSDLIPYFVAFIASLVMALEIGILIAIGLNLLYILYHAARPKISVNILETYSGHRYLKITPDRCLIFPSVEYVRNLVIKSGVRTTLPVVIDCTYIYAADYTAADVISTMIKDFNKRDQKIVFFNLKPSVAHMFEAFKTHLLLCYTLEALHAEIAKDKAVQDKDNDVIGIDTIL